MSGNPRNSLRIPISRASSPRDSEQGPYVSLPSSKSQISENRSVSRLRASAGRSPGARSSVPRTSSLKDESPQSNGSPGKHSPGARKNENRSSLSVVERSLSATPSPRGTSKRASTVEPGERGARDLTLKDDGRIKVCVRCRPLNKKEEQEGSNVIWSFKPQHVVELDHDGRTPTGKTWAFDNVFGPDVSTKDVFDSQCLPIVHGTLDGYNGTVFAYGQTSSGKTYTLMGNPLWHPGVVILSMDEIFHWISMNSHMEWDVHASYIEIYNESLTDLLQRDTRKGKNMKITEDKDLGPTVKDLKEVPVLTRQACLDLILDGEKRRTYASTNMNETSSRSHTIFRLKIEGRRTGGAGQKDKCAELMSNVAREFLLSQQKLHADRAALYLVDETTNELFIQAGEITLRLPMSKGLAGTVAATGETINIVDAYKDDRFDSSIDQKTGYRTKSILCMPIRGSDSQIIGVVQFINKMHPDSEEFNSQDEQLVAGLTQRLAPLISSAQGTATVSTCSLLNLVDLAGSERASKSGASGDILKQAGYINQSLHTLGACIAILSEGKKQHVPFRDSKMTQMLSSSLGGNARTALICAVSPASSNRSETQSTLQFASRAKKIVNKFRRNAQRDQAELAETYEAEIARLKEQLNKVLRSSITSADHEAIYKLQANLTQIDGSYSSVPPPISSEIKEKLVSCQKDVAEAEALANKSVGPGGSQVFLRAMIASEGDDREDAEIVIQVRCSAAGDGAQAAATWVSEDELRSRLEWLRKQDAAGTLDSCFTHGGHSWEPAQPSVTEQMPMPVPQVLLDGVRSRKAEFLAGLLLQEVDAELNGEVPVGSLSAPVPPVKFYRRSERSTWPRKKRSGLGEVPM